MNEICAPSPMSVAERVHHFQKLGFGIFIHYGLYSLLEQGEWAYLLRGHKWPEYARLTEGFTGACFKAETIADFLRNSGARYAVLTTRHHEGFSLYDTRGLNTFDAPHSAAGRDLVAEFVEACHMASVEPFFYHTTTDWWWRGKTTKDLDEQEFNEYLDYLYASVEILCKHYGKIGGFWFDGNWSRPDADWKEGRLYQMIRQHQPDAILVNNTGLHARGATGHDDLDVLTYEQAVPADSSTPLHKRPRAKETCETINGHWGFSPSDYKYKSVEELINNLCICRKRNSNYLLNLGADGSGELSLLERASILRMGDWLRLHRHSEILLDGDVVHASEGEDRFLIRYNGNYYYFIGSVETSGDSDVTVSEQGKIMLTLNGVTDTPKHLAWLDNDEPVQWNRTEDGKISFLLEGFPYGVNCLYRVLRIAM